ncbi:MAG: hypothetical protein J2P17_19240, partial [Mycobacterium sp.]|nr:hypothetical protein [Mycobacterium sp.]
MYDAWAAEGFADANLARTYDTVHQRAGLVCFLARGATGGNERIGQFGPARKVQVHVQAEHRPHTVPLEAT